MISAEAAIGFSAISFVIAIAPGASWAYVISTTAASNRRTGLMAVAGNGSGILLHAIVAAWSLQQLDATNAQILTWLQRCGAVWLLFLGGRILLDTSASNGVANEMKTDRRVFRDGMLVNVFNPKVFVLMLSLLPQFLDRDAGPMSLQIITFGGIHVVVASMVLSTLVEITVRVQNFSGPDSQQVRWLRRATGFVLIAFGIHLIIS